ncbi:MAG: hypothetical protein C4B59_13240 [Candidatus Methanogaster sp.]|uniref:Uncharacterized protein n=1 Tax=Candidatus Methanogaster sp. TaxID=3386292 RepID=A0AC61L031_9EURY|nr:MAG: hypothetical protein C4B59_13240 [ANME-2 cluster archaeon]
MKGKSHESVTREAFDILREIGDETSPLLADDAVVAVVDSARETDYCKDLELVDVDDAVDDPHKDEWLTDDDDPYKRIVILRLWEINFTAFNHYIDIKKGTGTFDDYDGYSYKNGSASRDEYQDVFDLIGDIARDKTGLPNIPFIWKARRKVDKSIHSSLALKDNYVHAPGHKWYRIGKCSISLERYSFPDGKGAYKDVEKKCEARFPMFGTTGNEDKKGVPWSIFMPVDNMAYYWYSKFSNKKTGKPADLGPVMHAIQDASVPHHAAGYCGNWHYRYETDLQSNIPKWLGYVGFTNDVKRLFSRWNKDDESPPSHLNVGDWEKTPARNWSVDQLVTWVALNAYREYDETYDHFKYGYKFDEYSAINLVKIATAMSLLVLKNAADHLKSRP